MPEMKERNHGHIVALTSVAGLSYIKDQMPFSVAQFAVQGLAESLMEHLRINKTDGVYVTLTHIYPFIVDENSDLRLRLVYFEIGFKILIFALVLEAGNQNVSNSVVSHI